MKLKPYKFELPKQSQDDNFIYNTKKDDGNKVKLFTFDKKNKKECFPIYYKRVNGELIQISEKDYEKL